MWCGSCARTVMKQSNWLQLSKSGSIALPQELKCFGCDRFMPAHAWCPGGLKTRIAFCFRCYQKLVIESNWEECTRRPRDIILTDDYTPDTMVKPTIYRGH